MDIEKEREAFEAWCHVDDQFCTHRYAGSEDYSDDYAQCAWLAWQAAKAQAVPEGFVLVSKDKLHEWKCMARRSEELGCPDCYESRGYSHNLAEEIEAQEQSK